MTNTTQARARAAALCVKRPASTQTPAAERSIEPTTSSRSASRKSRRR
ncbi:MAG: hypothetical protein R3F14_33110 [Polyangiaceae bacterium]